MWHEIIDVYVFGFCEFLIHSFLHPLSREGRVAADQRGFDILHGFQQSLTCPLAPHQDEAKLGRR